MGGPLTSEAALLNHLLSCALLALLVSAPASMQAASPPSGEFRAGPGERVTISGARGRVLSRERGVEPGDGFGQAVAGDPIPGGFNALMYGAPGGDDGAGRVWAAFLEGGERNFYFSVDGAALEGGAVRGFGQSLITLGHIDPLSHWAAGAPGDGDPAGPPSAVVILHAPNQDRLVERWRLESDPEARLGWQITLLDHDPEDSIVDHFAVSAPGQPRGRRQAAGAIYGISSVDGEVAWMLLGNAARFHLGYAMDWVSDWDGDGVRDLLVGAPHPKKGRVLLVSAASGQVLWTLRSPAGARLFGLSVHEADLDGDGTRDVLVGAPGTNGTAGAETGAVYAFAGTDRRPLFSRQGEEPGQKMGVSVSTVGDRDGDGLREVLVASLYENPQRPERGSRGAVEVFGSASGELLVRSRGRRPGDRLGWGILRGLPDIDGDGVDDYFTFSPRGGAIYLPQ